MKALLEVKGLVCVSCADPSEHYLLSSPTCLVIKKLLIS